MYIPKFKFLALSECASRLDLDLAGNSVCFHKQKLNPESDTNLLWYNFQEEVAQDLIRHSKCLIGLFRVLCPTNRYGHTDIVTWCKTHPKDWRSMGSNPMTPENFK